MKILLDECLPRKLKNGLKNYSVFTVPEMGWAGTKNGALLKLASKEFDVFVTLDQNLQYQQSLKSAPFAVILLVASNSKLETLMPLMPKVEKALQEIPLHPGLVLLYFCLKKLCNYLNPLEIQDLSNLSRSGYANP